MDKEKVDKAIDDLVKRGLDATNKMLDYSKSVTPEEVERTKVGASSMKQTINALDIYIRHSKLINIDMKKVG